MDSGETWNSRFFGYLVEQVDGMVSFMDALDDAFFKNNLFRPSNPFRKMGDRLGEQRRGRSDAFEVSKSGGMSWTWKGDLSLGADRSLGALDINEVKVHVGRLNLSDDFEIKFDLFYLDEPAN